MDKSSTSPFQWLNLTASEPYYLSHFLLFFSYFVVRTSASPNISHRLIHREIQAILTLATFAAFKIVKDETWEAFIADMLFCAKLLLVAMSLIMDYHLAFWYIVVCSVIYILTEQPAFEGLGLVALCSLFSVHFWLRNKVNNDRYSNTNLSFGVVDLGLFPNAAEKFGISLSGGMSQLPTYILFEGTSEVTRFPEWNFEAKSSRPTVTKRLLSKHFELDRLLVEYLHGK